MSESTREATATLAPRRAAWRLIEERLWGWALTPAVAFPALWLLGLSLAQVHVLAIQTNWSPTVWLVMIEVPIAFVAGSLLAGRAVGARARIARAGEIAGAVPLRWLWALVAVGWLGLTYQFAQAHEIPLLSSHIDRARTALNGGAAALLTDALTVSAAAAIAVPRRAISRAAIPSLAIVVVSLAGWALAGGRSTIALPIAVGLVTRWLYWRKPSLPALAAGAILIGGFLSFWFYLRAGQDPPTQAFPAELYGSVLPSTPRLLAPLLPLHFALALNFEALARVIDYFPAHMAYGHGAYDAWALHAVLPARSLGTVSARLSGPWLVSTAAGPLWADGGALVVAFGMLVVGALTTAPHAVFRRSHRFSDALLAAYFLYLAVFCVYTDLLTQYKDWVVVALGLWVIGRVAERAPPVPETEATATSLRARPSRRLVVLPRSPRSKAAAVVLLGVVVGAAVIAESERGHVPSPPRPASVSAPAPLPGARGVPTDAVLLGPTIP